MAEISRRTVHRAFLRAAHDAQWLFRERAIIGALNSAGQQVVHAPGRPGWVYVRIERGDKLTVTVALNTMVEPVYGMPVWVGPNQDGLLAVRGIREAEVVEELGTQAAAATLPEVATKGLVSARRIQPGLVVAMRQGGAYTMSVYAYPFAYVYRKAIASWPGGWIDLTNSIPGAGLRRWALVCLDPATNALDIVDGDTYGIPVTLTADQLADIDPGGMIPLAGVNLFNGMSAIDNETLFLDARPLVTGDWGRIPALLAVSTATVSDPPEDDELDNAFGTPAGAGAGFVVLLDNGGADSNVYLIASNGTGWWYAALTKAVNS